MAGYWMIAWVVTFSTLARYVVSVGAQKVPTERKLLFDVEHDLVGWLGEKPSTKSADRPYGMEVLSWDPK